MFLILLIFGLVLFSEDPILMSLSLFSLYLTYRLFWRKHEPKVIFFGVLITWLTITIKIFYANISGLRYADLSRSPNIVETTYVSLVGFCFFCFGLWFAIKDLKLSNKKMNELFNTPIDFNRLLMVYVAVSIIHFFLKAFIFSFPGFSQLISGFIQMKLGFLFLILFYTFKTKKHLSLVFIIILVEIVFSLFSYFSNFKDIVITAIVIITIFPVRLNMRETAMVLVLSSGFLYAIFLWQAVKGDYREYLRGGKSSQSVVVSQENALKKLQELSGKSGSANKNDVLYQTVDRISYIEFFSQATDNVPSKISYENGKLWVANIMHVLQPRILFPGKEAIDDSKMVNKYATVKVSTASQGTTFSLGYMAESYIDFGPYLMFIPIFFVGWLLGFIYKKIILQSMNYLWGFTMVSSLWININCNGTPGSKILGWIIMYYIAFLFFRYFLMKPLDRYVKGGNFFNKL